MQPPKPRCTAFLVCARIVERQDGEFSLRCLTQGLISGIYPVAQELGIFGRLTAARGDYDIEVQLRTLDGEVDEEKGTCRVRTNVRCPFFFPAITVDPGTPAYFTVSAPATAFPGETSTITVTAIDPFGDVATTYTGTVHFSSTDGSATLPSNYTFVSGDHGVHVFSGGVTLQTVGDQVVVATDVTDGTIAGSAAVSVADPLIRFSAVQYTVNQTLSGTWSGTATVTLQYTGPVISSGTMPHVEVVSSSGSAVYSTDYSISGSSSATVTFSSGSATETLSISVTDQHVPTGGQDYFTLNLPQGSQLSGYAIDPNLANAVVFIGDNTGVNTAVAYALSTDPAGSLMVPVAEADLDVTTGAVRLSQPLDFDQSPGAAVGGDPALVYNSATTDARPIIEALVNTNPTAGLATSIQLNLTWPAGGTAQGNVTFTPNGTDSPGDSYALAVQVKNPVTSTGFYNWSLLVTFNYTGGSATATVTGTTFVDVATASPFGAGWGIQSVDQLYDNTSAVAIVTGAGDYRIFTAAGTVGGVTSYTSPPEDFGTLVKTVVGATTTYAYTEQDGTVWNFNGSYLQTSVVDPHGLTTTYSYNGSNQLDEVQARRRCDLLELLQQPGHHHRAKHCSNDLLYRRSDEWHVQAHFPQLHHGHYFLQHGSRHAGFQYPGGTQLVGDGRHRQQPG